MLQLPLKDKLLQSELIQRGTVRAHDSTKLNETIKLTHFILQYLYVIRLLKTGLKAIGLH